MISKDTILLLLLYLTIATALIMLSYNQGFYDGAKTVCGTFDLVERDGVLKCEDLQTSNSLTADYTFKIASGDDEIQP